VGDQSILWIGSFAQLSFLYVLLQVLHVLFLGILIHCVFHFWLFRNKFEIH